MNGVLGFANMLLDTPLDAEQREFAESVQRSGAALLSIIDDVLDYSKIEAGRMTIEHIEFDWRAVCDEVRAILQPAVAERKLAMSLACDATLPRFLLGDPVRIRQVLLNLAGNAVKFTERGTVRIDVARRGAAQLKISVTDSGIGITAEQLDRLFRRFTQADSSTTRRYGGTGLGLAISKTLVELMGGSIGADSRPGTGSTFWVVLPLVIAPAVLVNAIGEPPAARSVPSAAERGGRLLLVEDNFVNERVAVYMLTKLGATVEVARNGREAIDLLSQRRYDLVLMDCQMPEMDGFEATRIIRDHSSTVLDHAVPVVAMTANAFPEDRERALACGMDDFLAKPVDRSVLVNMLDKWLTPAQVKEARAAAG
jgi:CheY-like chemotaxis protein